MLEALDRANLFLVPLDDRRRGTATTTSSPTCCGPTCSTSSPTTCPSCTGGRATGTTQNGDRAEAIRHALAGEDFERAADLDRAGDARPCASSRQEATLLGWLRGAARRVVRRQAGAQRRTTSGAADRRGELEGVEARLQDAERWLGRRGGRDRTASRRSWSTTRGVPRAPGARSRSTGRPGAGCRATSPATDRARPAGARARRRGRPPRPRRGRRRCSGWRTGRSGDLEAAHRATPSAMREPASGPGTSPTSSAARSPWPTSGSPRAGSREAMSTYEQACSSRPSTAPGAAGHGRHARRAGDLAPRAQRPRRRAAQHLQTSAGARRAHRAAAEPLPLAGRDGPDPGGRGRPRRRARRCSTRPSALYVGDFSPNVRPVAALKARVLDRARATLAERRRWARERGLSADDELSYLREFEHITLARVLLARHGRRDGSSRRLELLERLLAAAEDGGRTGSVIEILVLQALAHQARGDSRGRARPLGTRPDAGRARGLRPRLRRRGPADGGPAARRPRSAAIAPGLRPSTPGRLRHGRERRTPSRPGTGRAAERARARRAPPAPRPIWTARTSPASSSCR